MEGKIVIVTGGGYGIGRAIAVAFARAGCNVVVAGRTLDKLEAAAAELSALGTRPLAVRADVADEEQCAALVERTLAEYGRIDVLVNNAGIAGPTALAKDIDGADWRGTLAVNLDGAFYCAKHVSTPMIAAESGNIINISSVAGRIGYPLRSPYAASKWGLIGLSHTLAAELGRYRIRVNVICPGPIAGARIDQVIAARAERQGLSLEEARRWFTDPIPLGRMPAESEVATAALFLASDAASAVTGQVVNVDGGFRMQ